MIDLPGTPKDQSQMSRFSHYYATTCPMDTQFRYSVVCSFFALHIKIGPIRVRTHSLAHTSSYCLAIYNTLYGLCSAAVTFISFRAIGRSSIEECGLGNMLQTRWHEHRAINNNKNYSKINFLRWQMAMTSAAAG